MTAIDRRFAGPLTRQAVAEHDTETLILRQTAFAGAVTKWLRTALETLPLPDVDQTWPSVNVDREDIEATLQAALAMMTARAVDEWATDKTQ